MDLEEQVINGEAIRRFLNDDTVKRILAGLQIDYFEDWKTADASDKRDEIRARARALDDLIAALERVVESGKLATHAIEQLAKPQIA